MLQNPRSVFVIDEQPLFRLGLTAVLRTHPGIVVAGEGHHIAEAIALAGKVSIDCVFLGARGHVLDTPILHHVRALRSSMPRAGMVLVLDEVDEASRAGSRLAGAGTCLTRAASLHEVLQAALTPRFGPSHVASSLRSCESQARESDSGNDLTERETALLQLMARGLSNKNIADKLSIKVPTVKFHVGNILSKLHAENRTAAVLTALRSRLIRVEAA